MPPLPPLRLSLSPFLAVAPPLFAQVCSAGGTAQVGSALPARRSFGIADHLQQCLPACPPACLPDTTYEFTAAGKRSRSLAGSSPRARDRERKETDGSVLPRLFGLFGIGTRRM